MDLSFTRRRKGQMSDGPTASGKLRADHIGSIQSGSGTPDLQILLSAAAARQSSSPTARAAATTDDEARMVPVDDPRIGLFAGESQQPGAAACPASFSAIGDDPLNPRERS
jgi:hypothetical protein